MANEIERKFLVVNQDYKNQADGVYCRQGYICAEKEKTIRVRIIGADAYLTLKGPARNITRKEFEYSIPIHDAEELFTNFCQYSLIEKNRYTLNYEGKEWVVDEYFGDNKGLVIAEIELEQEEETFMLPLWAGKEVTNEPRYLNANLARVPFKSWK
ncbi:MAG: CYTH domain-containing protein [Candidatus Rifleibacteriota bacterium]